MTGNKLAELPEDFCKWKGLLVLYVQSNQLKGLPKGFSAWEKLEELNISSNAFTDLPDNLGPQWFKFGIVFRFFRPLLYLFVGL